MEISKLAKIAKKIVKDCRIDDVMGLSETRWNSVSEHVTTREELLVNHRTKGTKVKAVYYLANSQGNPY